MKKFLFLISLFVIASVFSGCDKDKDDDDVSIVGTWEYSRSTVTGGGRSQEIKDDELKGITITFNADGTLASSDGDAGIYNVKGNSLSMSGTDIDGNTYLMEPGVTFTEDGYVITIKSQTCSVSNNILEIKIETETTFGTQKIQITTSTFYKKI